MCFSSTLVDEGSPGEGGAHGTPEWPRIHFEITHNRKLYPFLIHPVNMWRVCVCSAQTDIGMKFQLAVDLMRPASSSSAVTAFLFTAASLTSH